MPPRADDLPIAELVYLDTGELFQLVDDDPDSPWQALGVCPKPTTVLDTIVYHIAHGALMHYPLWNILVFAWRNRHSFTHPEIDDAVGDSELTPIPTEYQLPLIEDTRKAQFISMTLVDSALAHHVTDPVNMTTDEAIEAAGRRPIHKPLQTYSVDATLVIGGQGKPSRVRDSDIDDASDSLLLTMYGRDSLDVNDKFMQDGD